MFPHIHHERGNEAGYISIFMQTDPVIGESATAGGDNKNTTGCGAIKPMAR